VRLVSTGRGWDDYQWLEVNDRRLLRRANDLVKAALREPLSGVGKPERLRYGLADTWSRRIGQEHRLVYRVIDDELVILTAGFHDD